MAEEVKTGGVKRFVRTGSEKSKLDPNLAKEIKEGYKKADERKRIERRNKKIKIGIAILILLAIAILSTLLLI